MIIVIQKKLILIITLILILILNLSKLNPKDTPPSSGNCVPLKKLYVPLKIIHATAGICSRLTLGAFLRYYFYISYRKRCKLF